MITFKTVCISTLFLLFIDVSVCIAQDIQDKICGEWITAERNLVVRVFRKAGDFKAKIIWFKNDGSKPDIIDFKDESNPNPNLRGRKILGMDIVEGLVFKPETKSWEKGKIYDPYHGRFWDSSASLTADGKLKVTGYWKFKWIGKTLTFDRLEKTEMVGKI